MTQDAPLTPAEDADPVQPAIDFSPETVAYNEDFENELMKTILNPPDNSSHPTPSESTPMVPPSSLPLPLNSPLRTHPSPILGLYLTHPHGYHTGGPGAAPSTIASFAEKFIEEHGIREKEELERIVEEKIRERLVVARERMTKREEMVKRNEEVRKKLVDLEVQRQAELRVEERLRKGARG